MMRTLSRRLAAVVALLIAPVAAAQTTSITYQGLLTNANQPANGSFAMEFQLFDASVGGNQVGPTISQGGVAVADGLFTVILDFGAAFSGNLVYLEITVNGVPLTPRTMVTRTPEAIHSIFADNAGTALYSEWPWQPIIGGIAFHDGFASVTNGAIGIGTTSPNADLDIETPNSTKLRLLSPQATGARILFQDDNSPPYELGMNAAEEFYIGDSFEPYRIRIAGLDLKLKSERVTVDGNQLTVNSAFLTNRGAVVTGGQLEVGNQRFQVVGAANALRFRVETSGDVIAPALHGVAVGSDVKWDAGTGRIGPQSSSRRFKENIEPLDEDFTKVFGLAPVSYTYKSDDLERRQIGYIAEEVHDAGLHGLVVYGPDNLPMSVAYDRVPLYLVEVVRDQRTRIAELEETNGRLAEALVALEERLTRLESRRVPGDR